MSYNQQTNHLAYFYSFIFFFFVVSLLTEIFDLHVYFKPQLFYFIRSLKKKIVLSIWFNFIVLNAMDRLRMIGFEHIKCA